MTQSPLDEKIYVSENEYLAERASYSASIHRHALSLLGMPVFIRLSIIVLIGLVATSARAADQAACLTRSEQRAAVASHQAIPLAQALKNRTRVRNGDVVRARLCRESDKLVYVLT